MEPSELSFQYCTDLIKQSISKPFAYDFCHLLITFANSLDPDQDQNVRPDLDLNRLTLR